MPKKMEQELKEEAEKKAHAGKLHKKPGQTMEEAKDAYVYGTMRKTGWRPSREKHK